MISRIRLLLSVQQEDQALVFALGLGVGVVLMAVIR